MSRTSWLLLMAAPPLTFLWTVWLVIRVRHYQMAFETWYKRIRGITNTLTWGRCQSCRRLWDIEAIKANLGCHCGAMRVQASRPASFWEGSRFLGLGLLTLGFRGIRKSVSPPAPPA